MLVVKIELWPGGDESRKREICRGEIANVTRDNDPNRAEIGDYTTKWFREGHRPTAGIGIAQFLRRLGAMNLASIALIRNSHLTRFEP